MNSYSKKPKLFAHDSERLVVMDGKKDNSLLVAFGLAVFAGMILVAILFAMGALAYYGQKYDF